MRRECAACHEMKEETEYEPAKTCKTGFRSTCRPCRRVRMKTLTIPCAQCGVEFKTEPFPSRRHKYCSRRCNGIVNTGLLTHPRLIDGLDGGGLMECYECHRRLKAGEFRINKSYKRGRDPNCKDCRKSAWAKDPEAQKRSSDLATRWRLYNPGSSRTIARRHHLRDTYGISLDDFLNEHSKRSGLCDICKMQCRSGPDHPSSMKCDLSVDHCHGTNAFRGLLCRQCNAGIGFFKDRDELVSAAVLYLKRHGIQTVKDIG